MHGKKSLKTIFKVVFMIFQSILFIIGVCLLISSFTLYLKVRKMLSIPAKILIYSSILCLLLVAGAISGFKAINSKERWTIALYIILILTIINMESLMIMKFPALTEHVKSTGKNFWLKISESQKTALEKSFGCCGFDKDNRKKLCDGKKTCLSVFYKIAWGFRNTAEKILILLIFSQSLSIGLLCLLKLRR